MKYTTEITIDLPRSVFMDKFDHPDNMKHWQRGLKSYKYLFGEPGEEGSKMELKYQMGKRELVLIETIIKRNMPYEFHATYDAKGVHNIQKNYFKDIENNKTLWVSESEFQFSGIFMKLMGFFMPGAFKKQSCQYLEDFKAFAETGKSVNVDET
ncbi:MAG: SRPBCC family protein [Flavobacteriaceae bacterium]